jgi:[ribosomal protein S18]-alanine N-acetyltransferase
MSRAGMRLELEGAGCAVVPLSEHDLLEAVEIEESTGLSQWGWDAYRAELFKPEAIMLAARRDRPDPLKGSRLIGFAAARINADELHINNIGVRPESRRRGVGGALLGACLDIAARRGARLAVLEVRASNAAARALYERLGFAVVGERRRYYKEPVEDALIMTKPLGPKA